MHRITLNHSSLTPAAQGSAVALGNFDGVHKGHQAVILTAKEIAVAENIPSSVLTFEPHPVSVLNSQSAPFRLTTPDSKAHRIAALGVDYLFTIPFSTRFAQTPAHAFIEEVLIKTLAARHVIIGYDFIFGHRREGNASLLQRYANEGAYGFTQVQAAGDGAASYSSTRIRQALRGGDLDTASRILGAPYTITGTVSHGDKRGSTIGFPTLNLDTGNVLRPARGVYAVLVEIEDGHYQGVANIGIRPTFGGTQETLEVHLFDFDRQSYGETAQVTFVTRLRGEKAFDSPDQLVAQIRQDCQQAKLVLAQEPPL